MNILRRRMLHPLRSRHNPLTRAALISTISALVMAVTNALLEAESIRETAIADKKMIAELTQFAEGKAKLVEVTGKYAVERTVQRKTYEAR